MQSFSTLLETLLFTSSRKRKIQTLVNYFDNSQCPDRGYAVAVLCNELAVKHIQASHLKQATKQRVDEVLFDLSYDYVGDLAETIALIWPNSQANTQQHSLPALHTIIEQLQSLTKQAALEQLSQYLDHATATERWAMIKVFTGGMRVGVSAKLVKTALAKWSNKPISEIEHIWHGLKPPYEPLFLWLEDKAKKPEVHFSDIFHPLMLANPIDENRDFANLNPIDFAAEWKWDGIRVQLVFDDTTQKIFSRTGDNISQAFIDVTESLNGNAVLDGELLVGDLNQQPFTAFSFNHLQQRLNRKTALKKHLNEYPAFVRCYDCLFLNGEDLRDKPWQERRKALESFLARNNNERLDISEQLTFTNWDELSQLRELGTDAYGYEGIILKQKNSLYQAGRKRGLWFKWKRNPKLVDAILMYAQRGHGKRSSFYSDYTFGVWHEGKVVPIGKAYSGFTDKELNELDKFVRKHTVATFGPVRELEKTLVVEIAFDSAHLSKRHKSGIALRFPRFHRIRWDKPANEVLPLNALKQELNL